MDRKADLERKKAKLAALREEKERRRREKEAKDLEDSKLPPGLKDGSQRLVYCELELYSIDINNNNCFYSFSSL